METDINEYPTFLGNWQCDCGTNNHDIKSRCRSCGEIRKLDRCIYPKCKCVQVFIKDKEPKCKQGCEPSKELLYDAGPK